ncbi:MFS transporter [Haloactinomyces albus]|uniref:MFS transporter n=1 Tax=Haloactinomyces albus TaxID=1352928 RepID=A0AAE3ZIJ9_9ACTN|nr:MFS transporter [Haloactinomyces albus]MDR7303554.1 putative MFS transporter [Haloactinomyces albus]
MTTSDHSIDDAPLTAFHKRLTAYSSGGPFIDGYALTIIGIALITLEPAMGLSVTEIGLVGTASLVGVFAGGGIFGYVTDKVGRQVMYIADLLVLAATSVLTAFATDVWQIVVLRFLLGVAVGADYPIATSLLAEFLPRRQRGKMIGATFVVWAVGAAVAYLVGFLLRDFGPDAWRLMLASPAIFAVITLLLRLGTPESPRWLLSKGRVEEARAAIKKVYGDAYDITDLPDEQPAETSYWSVFRGPYLKRTVFVAVFWTAQVIPMFAVYTFAPGLLESFGLTGDANTYGGSALIALLFVVGGLPGLYLVEAIGRKRLLLWSFAFVGIALTLPAVIPGVPAWFFFAALAAFAVGSGASNFLQVVYPNEIFPTEVRATAVGVGTALSRIGAAIGTFLMPFALQFGVSIALLVGAAITAIGFVITLVWGIETKGRSLSDTASSHGNDEPQKSTTEPQQPIETRL